MTQTEQRGLLQSGSGTKFLFVFFITFGIAKLMSMAFNKIFTNVLEPSEMGQYAIILSATTMLVAYSSLGFPTTISRFTIAYRSKNQLDKLKNFIFSGFMIFFIAESLFVIIFIILYLTTGYVPDFLNFNPYILAVFVVAFIALSQIFSTVCYTISSALQNGRYYAITVIMRVLLLIPFSYLFAISLNMGVFGLIISLCLSELTVALYSGYHIIKDIGIGKFSLSETKKLLSFSVPVYVTGLFLISFNFGIRIYIDSIFPGSKDIIFATNNYISNYHTLVVAVDGKELIALYQYGAMAIVNLLLIAENMFRVVYRPIIFKYFERKDYDAMRKLTMTITKLFVIVMVFGSFLLYAFSPLLIPLFTQSRYLPAITVIPILLVAYIIGYLRTLLAYGHTLYYKNYWTTVAGVSAVIIATIVGVLIIPSLGLIGLGIVYLLIYAIQFIVLIIVSQHYFKIKYDISMIIRLSAVCIIATGTGMLLSNFAFINNPHSILISYSISSIVFAGSAILFKLISLEDVSFVKNLVKSYLNIIKNKTKPNSS
ncbi:MAG: lipopolysaccharide biosynthesis protein [Candidatus Heimdallarchaeaceae archaeon]